MKKSIPVIVLVYCTSMEHLVPEKQETDALKQNSSFKFDVNFIDSLSSRALFHSFSETLSLFHLKISQQASSE